MSGATRHFLPRAGIAVLSLVGLLLAAYLTLYKLGYFGIIQCGVGACEVVQNSPYAYLLGQPVALVNDHDPFSLRHQFDAVRTVQFGWRYLEKGLVVWRVAVSRR